MDAAVRVQARFCGVRGKAGTMPSTPSPKQFAACACLKQAALKQRPATLTTPTGAPPCPSTLLSHFLPAVIPSTIPYIYPQVQVWMDYVIGQRKITGMRFCCVNDPYD
mgnify:CR=1 FL=1